MKGMAGDMAPAHCCPPVSNDPDIAALLGRSPDDVSSTTPRSRGDELLSMMFDDDPIDERKESPSSSRRTTNNLMPGKSRNHSIGRHNASGARTGSPPPAVEPEPEPEAPPPAVEPEPEPEALPQRSEPEPEPPSPLSEEPDNNTTEENPPQDPAIGEVFLQFLLIFIQGQIPPRAQSPMSCLWLHRGCPPTVT